MRYIAKISNDPKVKRLMLAPEKAGCFVFLFDGIEDGPCFADHWFNLPETAKEFCLKSYGIPIEGWTMIADADEGYFQDRIAVVPIQEKKKK